MQKIGGLDGSMVSKVYFLVSRVVHLVSLALRLPQVIMYRMLETLWSVVYYGYYIWTCILLLPKKME